MGNGRADLFLVVGSVDVDVALQTVHAGALVVSRIQALEGEDPGENQVALIVRFAALQLVRLQRLPVGRRLLNSVPQAWSSPILRAIRCRPSGVPPESCRNRYPPGRWTRA